MANRFDYLAELEQARRRQQMTHTQPQSAVYPRQSVPEETWNQMNWAQRASLAPVPFVSDVLGLGGDVYELMTQKEPVSPRQMGFTALGALPFVPAGLGTIMKRAGASPALPSTENLAKAKDRFLYHSSPADPAELQYGIDPTNTGPWVSEVAAGAVDDVDEFLERATPLSWFSDEPEWVKMLVARKLNKHVTDVTPEDVLEHGHLALVSKKDPDIEHMYRVGEEGLSEGPYSTVTNLQGEELKAYETPLYEQSSFGENIEPFGVERNEWVSTESVEPLFQLTGEDLLDFLRRTGHMPTSTKADRIAALRAEANRARFGEDFGREVDVSYRGHHTAPVREGRNSLDDMGDVYPDDVYDPRVAGRYYGHGDPRLDDATARVIARARGKPDAEITVYRAVPKGVKDINPGDWVTVNKAYARSHGQSWVEDGSYEIVSRRVKARDLVTDANSIHEFGYQP